MVASPLERSLGRCVEICRETLDAYAVGADGRQTAFASPLLLAVVAFETAAETPPDHARRSAALLIASTLGREAAAVVRRHGLDEQLLRCAAACERAALLCEQAL